MYSRAHLKEPVGGGIARPSATGAVKQARINARRRIGLGGVAFGAAMACFSAAKAGGADRFTLDANASAAYDSNVSGGDTTIANLRGLQPGDITYTLGTTVAFLLPSSRQTFFLNGAADFQRHEHNSVLDSDNYRISAGLSERFGSCSGSGTLGYSRNQTLIQDLAVAVTKNMQSQDTANLSINCGRRAIFVELDGTYSKITNDATRSGFVDSTTDGASASIGYRSQTLGNLSLGGQYSTIQYGADPLFGTTTPKVHQYGVNVRYSRKIGLRLSGSAGVSYNRIEGGLIGTTQSDGFGANASLAYRATARTQITLDYTLGNIASPLANASYVRSEALQLSGTHTLTRRISVQAGISRSREDYRSTGVVALLQLKESTTDQVNGSVSVNLGRKVTASLNAAHTYRTADLSQFNYSDDRVSVSLNGRF
jgi:hypothetical protein